MDGNVKLDIASYNKLVAENLRIEAENKELIKKVKTLEKCLKEKGNALYYERAVIDGEVESEAYDVYGFEEACKKAEEVYGMTLAAFENKVRGLSDDLESMRKTNEALVKKCLEHQNRKCLWKRMRNSKV